MKILTLASLTGTGSEDLAGSTFAIGQYGVDTVAAQVRVETSVTSIAVQGRMNSSHTWNTIWTATVDGDSAELPVMPEMRAVITDANGLCSATIAIRS